MKIFLEYLAVALIFCIAFLMLSAAGNNLETGPRFTDDNQLYRLKTELSEDSTFTVIKNEISTRFSSYQRLLPVFSVHKVIQAKVFGTNIKAWSIYTALLIGISAFIFYTAMRIFDFACLPALAFTTVSLLGRQSEVAWRLIQGEGPALLFMSLALLFVALLTKRDELKFRYTAGAIIATLLSSLCKESFILLTPALAVTACWASMRRHEISLSKSVIGDRWLLASLACIFAVEILTIKFVLGTTSFHYAGWFGVNAIQIFTAAEQLTGTVSPIATVLLLLVAATALFCTSKRRTIAAQNILMMLLICALISIPQVLLYHYSGFNSRYLVPATFSLGLLWAGCLQVIITAPTSNKFSRGIAVSAALLLYVAQALNGYQSAIDNSRKYAEQTKLTMIWYSDITSCAGIDDEIVVIFEGTYKHAVKFKFIATGFMNRENLSYYSIPQGKRPRPPRYSDIRAHGREIEQYSTYSRSHHLPKVLVFPRSNNEASFLRNPPDWFDQESYLRIAYPGRRVNYYYECDPRIDRS